MAEEEVDPAQKQQKGTRTQLVAIERDTPGYMLVYQLYQKAKDRSVSTTEMAEQMGISQSTLSHLRTGRRLATELNRENIEAIAKWMEQPVFGVMLMAEQVTHDDLYLPNGEEDVGWEDEINRALRFIRDDPEWACWLPRDIESASNDLKRWVIWCYDQAAGTKLLRGGINYHDLLGKMSDFRAENPIKK